jgi:RNA polymerase sigma factor for flagellar operon FliA
VTTVITTPPPAASTSPARSAAPAGSGSAGTAALIPEHLPLVGHLVRELLHRVPAHVDRDDLTSAGMVALVTAARSYDADRGTPFGRFAVARIRGALLDELRGMDWASRSVRARSRQLQRAQQDLTTALRRTPTVAELAHTVGLSVAEVSSVAEDVQRAAVLSLESFANGVAKDMVADKDPGPEDLLLQQERLEYLQLAVDSLPDRLRKVVTGYFLAERPMSEIAAELGVSESRVSQLRAEALNLLRDGMNTQLDPGLVDLPRRPGGCVARRREAYYSQIAAHADLRGDAAASVEPRVCVARSA